MINISNIFYQPSARIQRANCLGTKPELRNIPAFISNTLPILGHITLFLTLMSITLMSTVHAQSTDNAEQSSANILKDLPVPVSQNIKTVCLPSQFNEGASGYRQCVSDEVDKYRKSATKEFESLPLDDKYAVQASCNPLLKTDRKAYRDCLEAEVKELATVPEPNITEYSDDEQYALRQSCFKIQTQEGASAYRNCLNKELKALNEIQSVSMAGLSIIEKNEIQLGCSPSTKTQSAANYRLCLAQALENLLKEKKTHRLSNSDQSTVVEIKGTIKIPASRTAETTSSSTANNTPATAPVTAISDTQTIDISPTTQNTETNQITDEGDLKVKTRIISKPQIEAKVIEAKVTAVKETEAVEAASAETGTVESLATPTPVVQVATVRKESLNLTNETVVAQQSSTSGVDNSANLSEGSSRFSEYLNKPFLKYGRYLSLILPLVLLLSLWRLIAMLWPSPSSNHSNQSYEFAKDTGSHDIFDHDNSKVSTARKQLKERISPSVASQASTDSAVDSRSYMASRANNEYGSPVTENSSQNLDRISPFGKWLEKQSESNQKRYCTEFLLYWISYGENKFDPAMKQELLNSTTLSDHDMIKKWVLLKDNNALVDTLKLTRKLFSGKELEQIISLVFAVLVEHSITPVQNVFLRFFADFAGIGANGLNNMYQEVFGAPLPPIPRPDDARWWDKRADLDKLTLIKAQSEREVMLARLGLHDPVSDADVISALDYIATRFNPERFNLLGEKEKRLIQRHYNNYQRAHEFLLGESV